MSALGLAEDLCLILLDESAGELRPLPGRTLRFGFAAAALLELAQQNRIDTDLDNLFLLDASPLDDPVTDPVLAQVAASDKPKPPEFWVRSIGLQSGGDIQDRALERLCGRGILERAPGGYYFLVPAVAHSRRYPGISGKGGDDVRVRIMRILFNDFLPDPSEADLIGLVEACGAFGRVLSAREFDQVRDRVQLVKSFNLLCRAAEAVIAEDQREIRGKVQKHKPIPDVPGLPLFGNALGMTGDLHAFLLGLHRRYGPVCRIRIPWRQVVVMSGREANEWVLKSARTHLRSGRQFADFCNAMEADRAIISMDGHDHIRLRRTAQAGYSQAVIERRIDEVMEINRRTLASWPVGKPLPTFSTMQRLVAQQVGILATGHSPREYLSDLKYYFDSLIFTVRRDRPRFMYAHRFRRVRPRIRRLYEEVLELHKPELREGCAPDLIDEFLELHREDPQFLSEADLMCAVIGPYIAALDTVAGTLGFAFLRLLSEPEYKQRLQAEADALFANPKPSAKDIRGMTSTHAFITETLRCYPVTPVMMRTVCNSFEFNGYHIPYGTSLMVATTVPHNDEMLYPNPEKFEIDRHLPPRMEFKQKGAFAPFGLGPHFCLGSGFAQVQIATVLATLLHYAEFDRSPAVRPGEHGIRVSGYPTIRPHKRCRFRVIRHKDPQLLDAETHSPA